MRPAGYAMSETAGGKNRRKRRSRVPDELLVMGELLRRGFEAQLSDRKDHVLLVQAGDSGRSPFKSKLFTRPRGTCAAQALLEALPIK